MAGFRDLLAVVVHWWSSGEPTESGAIVCDVEMGPAITCRSSVQPTINCGTSIRPVVSANVTVMPRV